VINSLIYLVQIYERLFRRKIIFVENGFREIDFQENDFRRKYFSVFGAHGKSQIFFFIFSTNHINQKKFFLCTILKN
jgi:hypothetical protein